MLTIAIPSKDDLSNGVGVKCNINGKPALLLREGDCLVYVQEGNEYRCKILQATDDGKLTHYVCASHGQENEQHEESEN